MKHRILVITFLLFVISLTRLYAQESDACDLPCSYMTTFQVDEYLFAGIKQGNHYFIDFDDGTGEHEYAYGDTVTINYTGHKLALIRKFTHILNTYEVQTDDKYYEVNCIPVPDDSYSLSSAYPYCPPPDTICYPRDNECGHEGGLLFNDVDALDVYNSMFHFWLYGEVNDPDCADAYLIPDSCVYTNPPCVTASGKVSVFYGCGNNNTLRKPFIFVEGLDNGCKSLVQGQYGDFGWNVFATGIDPNVGDPLPVRLMPELIQKLNKDGYDIILLDFNDGATYIEANGLLLVTLLGNIKQELINNGSKNEIVLAGASMGGMVCKYALNNMERNSNHIDSCNAGSNVRLFISFDSPQKGANIPIGDQLLLHFMRYLDFVKPSIGMAIKTVNREASRELILYHQSKIVNRVPYCSVLRSRLLMDQDINTYPLNTRKVAFANGSSNPSMLQTNSGGTAFLGKHDLMVRSHVEYLLARIKGKVWSLDQYNSSPSKRKVYSARIEITIPNTANILIPGFRRLKNTLPYDNAPGSYRRTNADFDPGSKNIGLLTGGLINDFPTDFPKHCFIPTISALALDINTPGFSTYFNSYDGGLSGDIGALLNNQDHRFFHADIIPPFDSLTPTPFDALYAPESDNQGHVQVTRQNICWTIKEVTPPDLYLQNKILNKAAVYEARNTIMIGKDIDPVKPPAFQSIRSSVGDYRVTPTCGDLTLRAGTEINLEDGFSVDIGGKLDVFIQPMCALCSPPYCTCDTCPPPVDPPVAQIVDTLLNPMPVIVASPLDCSDSLCINLYGGCDQLGFTYKWSDPALGTNLSPIRSALAPNTTYTVTVTDGFGRTASTSVTTPPTILRVSKPTSLTACDGTLVLDVDFNCPPYVYVWIKNGFTIIGATSNTLTGLCVSDVVCVTVTDGCNDTHTCCHTFENTFGPIALTDSLDAVVLSPSCYGGLGTVTLSSSGGGGPYAYHWNRGDTSASITAKAGAHYFSVSYNGCQMYMGHVQIPEPAPVMYDKTITDIACSGGLTGAISIDPFGGTSPYSYSWSNGSINKDIVGLGAGSYSVTITDANGCTGSGYGTVIVPTCVSVNLKFFIEGYYVGAGLMVPTLMNQNETTDNNITDTVIVELRDPYPPYDVIGSTKAILNRNGTVFASIAANPGTYYIGIRHRDAIQTWSAMPVSIAPIPTFYDFTIASDKAYGNNMVEVGAGVWAFYSGDVNQDENADLLDLAVMENDINNFSYGYFATDLNGDGNVDLLDNPLLENNINNFVFSVHP